MAGKKNGATAESVYEAKARSAAKFRSRFGREDRWRRYILRLAHVYYENGTTEDAPVINIMAARIRALVPQLAIGMPAVKIESYTKPVDPNCEPALAKVLEMLWETEDMDETTRRVTLDSETFGLGIGFVGYTAGFDSGEETTSKRGLLGMVPGAITERLSSWLGGGEDEQAEAVKRLIHERAFLDRISPLDFLLDPTASHFGACDFMGHALYLTPKQADEIFGKGHGLKAESVGNVGRREAALDGDGTAGSENSEIMRAVDSKAKRIMVHMMWYRSEAKTVFLDRDFKVIKGQVHDWKSVYPGFPYVPAIWDEVPDSVYPEGLGAALEPLTNELHTVRKRELRELRKGMRKWWSSGPLSAKARQGLMSDRDGEVIEGGEYDQLEPLKQDTIPAEMFTVENRIKEDMNEVSHTSPMQAAASASVRKTATETAFIQSSADAVTGYRQLMVERFTSKVMERLLYIVTELFDAPLTVKIENVDPMLVDSAAGDLVPLGETIEYTFVATDFKGFYRVKVEPGSMVAAAKDVERQHMMAMFKLFSAFEWFNAKEWAITTMASVPSIRDTSRYINKPQPPMPQPQAGTGAPMPGSPPPLSAAQANAGGSPGAGQIPTLGEVNPTAQGDMLSAIFGGMGGSPG